MAECTQQRKQCQALLAQLRDSQSLLKSQLLTGQNSSATLSSDSSLSAARSALTMGTLKRQTGILKTSSLPRSHSVDKVIDFNLNNSASAEKLGASSRLKNPSKVLAQGVSSLDSNNFRDNVSLASTSGRDTNFYDATEMKQKYDTMGYSSKFNMPASSSGLPTTSTQVSSHDHFASQELPSSPQSQSQTWRQILNKHVTVPSQLSAQELRDLDNLQQLNFSYSSPDDNTENRKNAKLQPTHLRYADDIGKTTVCKDITNKPVSVPIKDMAPEKGKAQQSITEKSKAKESNYIQGSDEESNKRRVKFFHDQLEDDGNSRKLNSFIKDATIKPKSLLNSTAYRSLYSSKQSSSGSSEDMTAEDQRLLGYDWIAALLDNDTSLVNQSESFFNELKDFRKAYKSECSNQFYREGPHTLVEFEPEPVVEALAETKVHPYIVNERLFTQPFKSGLIDYGDTDEKDRHRETEKKAPTEENPRFVRVSIPRSTLSTPYKVKPHRRRSFDGSDSCSLMDHCLLGWENTRPAMIPTAKSLDLNTEAGTRIDSQVTTLSEAEHLAAKFSQAEWPFSRPTARTNTLPRWRKHYMDTTLNLSRLSDLSGGVNVTGGGSGAQIPQDVKRSTDRILRATYSTMYEMERLRKERELEMAAGKN